MLINFFFWFRYKKIKSKVYLCLYGLKVTNSDYQEVDYERSCMTSNKVTHVLYKHDFMGS